MSRKVKILIAVGIAAVLLVVGIGIPVLAADTPTPTPPAAITKQAGVIDRTAEILHKTREELISAVKQAAQELKGKKPTADDYFARVAEILKIEKNTLVSAVQQAAKELRDANIEARLSKAQQNGVLTADEAKQIKDWYSTRPAAIDKLLNRRALLGVWGRCREFFGRGFKNNPNRPVPSPKASPSTTAFSTTGTAAYTTY